jgi:hypothetical protein
MCENKFLKVLLCKNRKAFSADEEQTSLYVTKVR